MSLTLILTRHAKSAWDDPTLDDFDRVLNDRGRKSARAIGGWLAGNGYLPDVVLVSAARRTRETWEILAGQLPGAATVESARSLYLAEPRAMLKMIQRQTADTVMMIGHNPGTALLAGALAEVPPEHPKFRQYPTAATTVLTFDCERWEEAVPGKGRVTEFVVPRDLIP